MSGSAPAGPFRGTERFELLRQLGAGGMGVVYEALDRQHGTRVALKALTQHDPQLLLPLKSEVRSLHGVVRASLASLLELIHDGGHTFFTMELVDGVSLSHWVRGNGVVDAHTLADGDSGADTLRTAQLGQPQAGYDEERLRASLAQL